MRLRRLLTCLLKYYIEVLWSVTTSEYNKAVITQCLEMIIAAEMFQVAGRLYRVHL